MITQTAEKGKARLEMIARRAMLEKGFLPDFNAAEMNEVARMEALPARNGTSAKDLRGLPWCSIDNDDSLDLDQLTVAAVSPDQTVRILVAVADVDRLVKSYSEIDIHASHNTTSVYTAAKTYPMLPDALSTDLTSLGKGKDRLAIVIEMQVDQNGEIQNFDIYPALVSNRAKLAYSGVAAWLEGRNSGAEKSIAAVAGLAENLHIQDKVAAKLRAERHKRGALELQTLEAYPVFAGEEVTDLRLEEPNRAAEIIEDFMIAANDVTALFLRNQKIPSLRRVVRTPKRWERIVELAAQYHYSLPAVPDAPALNSFMNQRRVADPMRFPDLSLSIIKLLGSGEYVVESADERPTGHFGLAVKDYTHSTAPNRRFPDLITQRILKARLNGLTMPYTSDQLVELAKHCTTMEDEANKIERMVGKSAAAMLLSTRIGQQFEALCTGAADKGTWVRIFNPPVEGRLLYGFQGVDVGDRLRVKLVHTDVEKGFIDFGREH